ncbi:MAG: T9SS type A sorting domain-containing protein, partial [Bacteroidota bacterium]
DQNADGYLDLVCSNGGDARVNAADTLRPAGKCLILSSLNGEMLGSISTPDQKETYFSPLLIESGSISEVILGTGGETVGGGVYKIPLDSLANNSAHPPERLVVNSTKGFVAVPSLGDFTKDGIADLAIPGLKESIYVLDGQSFQKVWEITLPQAEHYVSPTIGEFTGDDQLDIFAAYGIGNWPFYQGFVQVLIDGADGTIMWQDTSSVVQFSSANALDWDNDGVDEVLFMDNYDAGFQQVRLTTQMVVRDFNDDRLSTIGPPRSGINFFSMPLIDDLEGDGKFEVVYMYQTRNDNWYSMDGARVERFQLPVVPGRISWGRYLGNQGNGYHEVNIIAEMDMVADVPAIRVYPNPTTREVHLQNFTEGTFRLLTPAGQVVLNVQNQKTILLGDLAPGVYPFILETSQGTGRGRLLIMRE